MLGIAVNVTLVPAQIAPTGSALMLTPAATDEVTLIVMVFEVAGDPVAQVAFEVRTHVTTSLLLKVLEE